MNYEEAWNELYTRIIKADKTLLDMEKSSSDNMRLSVKREGIQLVKGYMEEMDNDIE